MSTSYSWEGKGRYGSFRLRTNVWVCRYNTVKSLENTCHTWALLRWWFTTKRRYIKCMHLYTFTSHNCGSAAWGLGRWTCELRSTVAGLTPGRRTLGSDPGTVVHMRVPLPPNSVIWYRPMGDDAVSGVFGASVTNLNEPPRALATSTIKWVRS